MAKGTEGIETVQKTLRLLDLLAAHNGELSVTQIASMLGCSISSANRFLQTLQQEGYAEKNNTTNRYELSNHIFTLGSKMLENNQTVKQLITLANAVSQKYDVSVNINTITGKNAMLIFRVTKYYNKDLDFISGETAPAYCTSSGKAVLSCYTPEQLDEYFRDTPLTAYQNVPVTEETLRAELETARARGYAVCREEYVSGVFSFSLPVRDKSGHIYAFTIITHMRERNRVFRREVIDEIRGNLDKLT